MVTPDTLPFGDVLRRYRLAAELTQEELAERASLSVRTVSDLERGVKQAPQRHTLRLLMDALELSKEEQAILEAAIPRRRGPAAATHPGAFGLPGEPTPLLGREHDEARAVHLLLHAGPRLLTLTGPGGVGKTRLALQVAATVAAEFADGVAAVSLAAIRNPELVSQALAESLGLRETAGQTVEESLVAWLQEKHLLLVLDNFEQVADAALLIAELIARCPRLSVLATSRMRLRLRGEQELEVPPLALPDPRHLPPMEDLLRYPAIALFVQRVRAGKPEFQLSQANARVVADICRKLDGLPLAIELAAARVKVLPPEALLGRLDRRLQVLTGGARDLPQRQQTMRNTIAWSFDLLDRAEQAIFRRFAVFTGGATLAAAQAICAFESPDSDILDSLTSLVDKSLLPVEEQETAEGYGEPRFVMLDTIREYGLEQLEQAGEREPVRRAHAAWFLGLAEEVEPELRGPEQRFWLTQLEAEHANLWAALQWAQESGEPVIGLRIATALWRFWSTRGLYTEGRTRLEALLELDAKLERPAPPLLRAAALNQAARYSDRQGNLARAMALSRESLALYRAAGDKAGIAASLSTLGGAMKQQGDYRDAMACLEESLALRRELGDTARVASILNSLGGAARWQGQYDRAESLFREAFALYTERGDTAGIGHMLFRLGEIALDRCDFQGARRLHQESLVVRGDLADKEGTGFVLNDLALVAHAEGDFERAAELAEQSVALFREVGARRQISCTLDTLARIILDRGDEERAAAAYTESLTLALAVGAKELVPYGLEGLGRIAGRRGRPERGARLYGAGAALRDSLNTPPDGHEREAYHRAIGGIRRALGEESFAAAWEEGRAMSMEQAAALALEKSGEP